MSSESNGASVRSQHTKGSGNEGQGAGPCPLVGVGASAGGLEAFTQLLTHLPADTGMVFLLVQHLDPRQESQLTDILARVTAMPVLEATDGLAVQPNHVYVIPPNGDMAIAHGVLHVTPRSEGSGLHLPVDALFRSLAVDQQQRAIGVVLSGTGADGTMGVCEIKAAGGITFAQDEKSAKFPSMPRSAIDNACVDFVLTPEAIALRLAEIGAHPYLSPGLPVADHEEERTDEHFRRILGVVRSVTGVDFSQYRDTTIRRRIMRRTALNAHSSLQDYGRRLLADRTEVEALYSDLLITVTSFFRDPATFEALKDTVFPALATSKSATEPLRIWVPGCSTGQEPYSLAMALLEFYDDKPVCPPIQIFATDLSDQTALEKARAGVYPESIEAEVSPERLRRFFKKEDHLYRIDKSVRDLCVFARQNVAADPPFSHVDLISCRNLLIYLGTPLQKRVLSTFHYALNEPGFLALGIAEAVGGHTDLFELVDRGNKIYARKATGPRRDMHFTADNYRLPTVSAVRQHVPLRLNPSDFQLEADRVLLSRYTPPGVLVNENLDVVQFRGRTSPYLESPPGEPTTKVLKLAREGLFLVLRNVLAEAAKQSRPIRREGVRLAGNGVSLVIHLEVIPIQPPGADGRCFLVLFQEDESAPTAPRLDGEGGPGQAAHVAAAADPRVGNEAATQAAESERELLHLRQELAATKEYLQSLIEQQGAANEELRAANEEILSSNEELQSTNEELETAKEEVQSANEELTTVNEQLQHRNLELTQVNNDLTNLLSSTAIPVIMVGGDLRIRRFTVAAEQAMNLRLADVGRPITNTEMVGAIPDLEAIIGEVVDKGQPVEREVCGRDGRWCTLRVHPYRTWDHKIDGAVVVLQDIDQLKRIEKDLREAEERMRSIVDQVMDGVITTDDRGRIESFNPAAESLFGFGRSEVIGLNVALLVPKPAHSDTDREVVGRLKDGSTLPMQLAVSEFRLGSRQVVVWIVRDLTLVKRLEQVRQQRLHDLTETDRHTDEFLAMLAHELRNPLAPIHNAIEIMRRVGDDPPAMTRALDLLQRQVWQLSRIIEDLVDVSRVSERKIKIRKERVALATVVERALETYGSAPEACDHQLTVALPPEPIYLDADPVRLSQVLINLLNNAAKFTEPTGQIGLTVERREAPDGPEVVIRVRDTGIGITADLLPHIFNMFRQGDRTLEATRGGLGIGLTLVRSLVQMHGGSVEAHSDGAGRGSEFVVCLPIAEMPPQKPDAQGTTNEPSPSGIWRPKRILVVDDEHTQTETLGMLLEMEGHEVRLAEDGPGALEMAAAFVPDVVLLDIGLPGMNGYEVARRIRAQPQLRHALLVAQTGWGSKEDHYRSKEAGFDHHVVKPADIATLLDLIKSPRADGNANG